MTEAIFVGARVVLGKFTVQFWRLMRVLGCFCMLGNGTEFTDLSSISSESLALPTASLRLCRFRYGLDVYAKLSNMSAFQPDSGTTSYS